MLPDCSQGKYFDFFIFDPLEIGEEFKTHYQMNPRYFEHMSTKFYQNPKMKSF
jgi:hypothetical protein